MAVKTQKQTELEKLEAKFQQLAIEIYEKGVVRIQPNWPWVLVRVVPKEQRFGRLYLPDNAGAQAQNKPQWEGIVLEVWNSHWSKIRQRFKTDGSGLEAKYVEEEIWRQSDFKRGDRVLFPHFAGMPGPEGLDPNKYRLVREWTFDVNGGASIICHYDCDKDYRPKLDKLFEGLESKTLSGK